MTDEELVALIDNEFDKALGTEGSTISSERALAWDFYLSKPMKNEIEGQSQVVTSDVSDVVDGLMPSLLRMFTTADNLVGFDPAGEGDEDAAEQESDYVNYVFFKQNPAFIVLYTWFFDALIQKNGIVKAWWDDSEIITHESYQGLSETELFELLDDEELEPIERSEREDETVVDGQITIATVHDVEFRRVSKRGRVQVENVPPEEFRISRDARSLDPSAARFTGHEREITRSGLIDMGFDAGLVDTLPSLNDTQRSEEARARRDEDTNDTPLDRSQQKVLIREAYIRIDIDDNGRSELRQITTASGHMLLNEPVDRQPFHVISPQPLPHKHFGRAIAEKVMDIQEVTTVLLRQTLDNLYHSNNPGHAVWENAIGENTIDDLLTTRVGRIARFSRPVAESWAPITVPFTAGASFPMLEFFDKLKRDRTGVSSDSEGLSPEALKNIQTTVLSQAVDISRMKIEAVARIFAETGIKSLFLHIHELLMKHQDKVQIVKLRNKWVDINPQQWRTRIDMTVNIGLGIGTRESNLLHLNAIWEKQKDVITNGGLGLLISPRNIFNTAAEIVKNANLKQPEMFFTDPGDKQPQEQPDPQAELAKAQLQIAQRQQQLDAEKQQIDREKAMLQHERDSQKIEIQRETMDNKLFVEMEKIRNQLTELELKFTTDVPGSRV